MRKVRDLRNQYNMSQSELARRAGISQSLLSDIESGKVNPTIKTLTKLAKALKVPITALLDETA